MKNSFLIKDALKNVLQALTPNRSVLEGMMKYDFKMGDSVQNVMQVSFSSLANWPLFLICILVWVDPIRTFWSLQQVLGEDSSIRFFLLSGQPLPMFFFLIAFFLLESLLKKEYLLVGLLFYFLHRSDLHLHLALAGIIGVYFARAVYLFRLMVGLESKTRNVWRWVTTLQLLVIMVTALVAVGSLDQFWPRFYYLISAVFLFHLLSFLTLATWGHFYIQVKNDPAYIPVHYSSALWLRKSFGFTRSFRKKLKDQVDVQIKRHLVSLAQVQEMKDQSLGVRVSTLENILNKELGYLQTAASRLTID